MRLVMPIDGWFFQSKLLEVKSLQNFLLSKLGEWQAGEGLPRDLRDTYEGLRQSDSVREWCCSSKEWKSLNSIEWDDCLLLPFASETAKVAAIYLQELARDHWPSRLIVIEDFGIDFLRNNFADKAFIGSYVVKLWELWKGRTTETALNLVCCPGDIVAISLLATAMDGVPIYCFSEALQQTMCIPGWEMPFLNDQERLWLNYLLEGLYQHVASQSFRSKWLPVIGMKERTVTGEIIQERLYWDSQKILELPPSPF
jgi:hypothetical protein